MLAHQLNYVGTSITAQCICFIPTQRILKSIDDLLRHGGMGEAGEVGVRPGDSCSVSQIPSQHQRQSVSPKGSSTAFPLHKPKNSTWLQNRESTAQTAVVLVRWQLIQSQPGQSLPSIWLHNRHAGSCAYMVVLDLNDSCYCLRWMSVLLFSSPIIKLEIGLHVCF